MTSIENTAKVLARVADAMGTFSITKEKIEMIRGQEYPDNPKWKAFLVALDAYLVRSGLQMYGSADDNVAVAAVVDKLGPTTPEIDDRLLELEMIIINLTRPQIRALLSKSPPVESTTLALIRKRLWEENGELTTLGEDVAERLRSPNNQEPEGELEEESPGFSFIWTVYVTHRKGTGCAYKRREDAEEYVKNLIMGQSYTKYANERESVWTPEGIDDDLLAVQVRRELVL